MADFPVITSPDGSTSFNIGSVMLADGVDYGMAGMFTNVLGGNPLVDGGGLGARFSGPRMFKFPIRLATVGNLTPAGVSKTLRQIAQGGAYVDLLLAGIATADAVRYDVIDGRVRETQDVKMWAGAGRREAMLELDVQPYGYMPTWITLASSASVGLPGTLAIPGGSIIGDVPGLAQINAFSVVPSQQLGLGGTYGYDSFLFSTGNAQPAFVPAASMQSALQLMGGGVIGSIVGDAAAPASQVWRMFLVPSSTPYYAVQPELQPLLYYRLATSHVGRYRLHAFARYVSPSQGGAIPLAADVVGGAAVLGATPSSLPFGAVIASVGQPLTLASDGAYVSVPTGFGLYSLGDITVPTAAGMLTRAVRILGGSPSIGVATGSLDIAGLWMQSLEGGQGVIARGLQNQISGAATYLNPYPFSIDARARDVQTSQWPTTGLPNPSVMQANFMASPVAFFSLLDRYRGVFPQLSPSMTSIEIMFAARRLQKSYRNEVLLDTPKVWWRFNEPQGATTVVDYSGNGVNGLASNMVLGASSLLYGEPGGATMATGFAFAANAAIPAANAPRTLEAWYQPATYSAFQYISVLGASEGAAQMFAIGFSPTAILLDTAGGNFASWAYAWRPGRTYHLAAAYSGTHATMYVNGQALATTTLPAAVTGVARLVVGNEPISNNPARGGLDEVAVYASALSADRILAHYIAGRNTMGATSPPVYQPGGYAGVSVRYQPRFTFTKEL